MHPNYQHVSAGKASAALPQVAIPSNRTGVVACPLRGESDYGSD
jgi:hypothetical protein